MSHNFKNNDGLVLKIQIGEIREKATEKRVLTNAFNGRPHLIPHKSRHVPLFFWSIHCEWQTNVHLLE